MFKFPKSSEVNQVIAKDKFPRSVRELIEKVIWKNKIQRETCNLRETDELRGFAVIRVTLKNDEIEPKKLIKIAANNDRRLRVPAIWRFYFKSGTHCFDLAFPRLAGEGVPEKLQDCERQYLVAPVKALDEPIPPTATSICELWKHVLCDLAEISYRPNESIKLLRERISQVNFLKKRLVQLTNKIAAEKQFNRRLVLFEQKNQLQAELQKWR